MRLEKKCSLATLAQYPRVFNEIRLWCSTKCCTVNDIGSVQVSYIFCFSGFDVLLFHSNSSRESELKFVFVFVFILYPVNRLKIKGEVRTINDRNICERRSCMKNNGKSPTFKFVSGEERRPSEVQRVSRGWRLPGATHSSADLTWIRKSLEIQAPELSEPKSVELELGRCCFDLDKQVSDKFCRTRKSQFEIPFRL